MAHHHTTIRTQDDNELWFGIPNSSRRQQGQRQSSEQSAYRTTTNRISLCSTSSRTPPSIPIISAGTDLNKPLPPSPSNNTTQRKNKSASLPGLLRREPSIHVDTSAVDTSHLRPEPYPPRHSSLYLNTNNNYQHNYSRSMPSSPCEHYHSPTVTRSLPPPCAHSAAENCQYAVQYQAYSSTLQQQTPIPPVQHQRPTMTNTLTPPRSRTFPEPTTLSPTARREVVSMRQRPHTWLSPTDPFTDPSQFHLFAEAMTGFHDSDPFSPTNPPQLQGSLFARRPGHDTIPIPLRSTRSAQRDDWQNFEPPSFVSSPSLPVFRTREPTPAHQWRAPSHINAIELELGSLGLDDEEATDDELPDYAQSQAEMHAQRRADASARARELEASWRGTRGR